MKTKLTLLSLILAATAIAQNAIPVPSPTVEVITIKQPIQVNLTADQVQALVARLSPIVTLPSGIETVNLRVVTSGSNAGSAVVRISFAK